MMFLEQTRPSASPPRQRVERAPLLSWDRGPPREATFAVPPSSSVGEALARGSSLDTKVERYCPSALFGSVSASDCPYAPQSD